MLKDYLKEFRLNKGLTQLKAAEEIGITLQTYNKIEKGFKRISISTINKLAAFLNLSIESIREML